MSSFFEKLKKGMEIEEKKPSKKKERKPKKEKIVVGEKEKKIEIKVKEEPVIAPPAGGKEKKLAGRSLGEGRWLQPEGQLTVDVYQTAQDIVIQSAIAGIEPEDLDITIENDVVRIKGNREKPAETEEKNYFYQECYWGPFSREIILPEEVDNSRTAATIKKGILTIRIPKIERKKKRKITVGE